MNCKQTRMLCGIALVALGLSFTANADPQYTPGYVTIVEDRSMTGTMNVRKNQGLSGDPYIGTFVRLGRVQFYGRDNGGLFFSCYVSSGTGLYEHARDIALNFSNGSMLGVSKQPGSATCTEVYTFKSSNRFD